MTGRFAHLDKAELHVHLEGSMTPETLCEINPALDLDGARARYRFHGFPAFIEAFKWAVTHLNSPDDYALALRRLLQRMAGENIRYAEITLSAGVVLWRKQDFAGIYDALVREAERSTVEIWWVLDAIRHFGAEDAMEVARLAVDRAQDRVAGFGIGGDETRGPAEWFEEVFAFTQSAGLALVPHAGETAGPESVWPVVRMGARRIGHGIRSIEDPALVRHLADHRIPLEISLTSNAVTGAVPSLREHPARRLYEAGVPIVLNTDDPGMFGVTLSGEMETALELGFSEAEVREIAGNAFRYRLRNPRS
ncbi:MAG: adenosine deaminase family protein [Acidobacteria bacterium]|nr:adenosine deaminase family protein [Acidobacteriota bacterium]